MDLSKPMTEKQLIVGTAQAKSMDTLKQSILGVSGAVSRK